nr:hypothetical protein [Armatimonas sp.]
MTLTIDVSPATARRISADPEALRRVATMIEAAFGDLEPERDEMLLSVEDEAALDEAYLAIQEGKVHSFNPEAARTKAKELLQAA